MLFYSE